MTAAMVTEPVENVDVAWAEVRAGLRAFIARRLANPQDVEDLVQEVLVRFLAMASSHPEIRNLHAWLHRVARNAVIDHYRTRRPQETLERATALADPFSLPDTGEHEDRSAARELAQCLRPLVDRLPAVYREALILTDLEGMTQTAAAAKLGLSVSGMKSRVQRGRLHLREILVDCCPIEVDRRGEVIDYVCPTESGECSDSQAGPTEPSADLSVSMRPGTHRYQIHVPRRSRSTSPAS